MANKNWNNDQNLNSRDHKPNIKNFEKIDFQKIKIPDPKIDKFANVSHSNCAKIIIDDTFGSQKLLFNILNPQFWQNLTIFETTI